MTLSHALAACFRRCLVKLCTLNMHFKAAWLQETALDKRHVHRDNSALLVWINSQGQMWVTIKQPSSWEKYASFISSLSLFSQFSPALSSYKGLHTSASVCFHIAFLWILLQIRRDNCLHPPLRSAVPSPFSSPPLRPLPLFSFLSQVERGVGWDEKKRTGAN